MDQSSKSRNPEPKSTAAPKKCCEALRHPSPAPLQRHHLRLLPSRLSRRRARAWRTTLLSCKPCFAGKPGRQFRGWRVPLLQVVARFPTAWKCLGLHCQGYACQRRHVDMHSDLLWYRTRASKGLSSLDKRFSPQTKHAARQTVLFVFMSSPKGEAVVYLSMIILIWIKIPPRSCVLHWRYLWGYKWWCNILYIFELPALIHLAELSST